MTDIEELDEEIKQLEEELKGGDASSSKYGSPLPQKKESFFTFFKRILDSDDSRKVSNLDAADLRKVRGQLDIALYAEAEGLGKVSQYLLDKAENVLSTAMSKKATFLKILVTQIKKEQKIKEPKAIKRGIFSGSKQEAIENEE